MIRMSLALAALCLAVPVSAQTAPGARATAPLPQPDYRYRIDFWRNLHHLLYAQALADPASGKRRPIALTPQDQSLADTLPAEDRAKWEAARVYYRTHLIDKHPLFDDELFAIGTTLSNAAEGALPSQALPGELAWVLESVAPSYRAHVWPRHQSRATAWRLMLDAQVSRHAPAIAQRIAAAFDVDWPKGPIPVDLVCYASAEGAYTRLSPDRIAISVCDHANEEAAALEIALHESAHLITSPLRDAITAAAQKQGVESALRPDLWHAAQFYIVGKLVADALPGYTPYAQKNALWDRAWPGHLAAFDAHLAPWLAGEATRDAAFARLVTALAQQKTSSR